MMEKGESKIEKNEKEKGYLCLLTSFPQNNLEPLKLLYFILKAKYLYKPPRN